MIMRVLTATLLVPLLSLAAGVQDPATRLESLNQKRLEWLKKNDQERKRLEGIIQQRQGQLELCRKNFGDDKSCGGLQMNEGGTDRIVTAINGMQGNLAAMNSELEEIDKDIRATSKQVKDIKDGAQRSADAKEIAEVARLQAAFNKHGLELNNLKFDAQDLGRKIDQMQLGQYVAAKMALMLNSKPFCDSMKRCAEPEGQAKNKVSAEQMKEIFPGMSADVFKGVDFWQAARTNRSQAAPAGGTK